MHPVIRIASFLLLAVFLSSNNIENLITAAILLLLLLFIYPSLSSIKQASKIIYRLRWLFFSIVVIYGWFTPGELLFPQWSVVSPYQQGIIQGLLRVIALMLLIISLTLLVLLQTRNELLSSIYWYCRPLKILGLSEQRLMARLILTFDAVVLMEKKWQENNRVNIEGTKLQQTYQRVLQLFDNVMASAEQAETSVLTISLLTTPAWYQWLIPFLLGLIFWFI